MDVALGDLELTYLKDDNSIGFHLKGVGYLGKVKLVKGDYKRRIFW